MQCKMISEDGWYIDAPTFEEAHETVINMMVANIGINEEEAQALYEHDVHKGLIQILHPVHGTHNVH